MMRKAREEHQRVEEARDQLARTNEGTVSIGVATFPEDGRVARALVDAARAAAGIAFDASGDRLTVAKRAGTQ